MFRVKFPPVPVPPQAALSELLFERSMKAVKTQLGQATLRAASAWLWLSLACACGKHTGTDAALAGDAELSAPGLVAQTPSVSGRVFLLGGPPKLLGRVLDLSGTRCAPSAPLAHPAWKMDAEGGLAGVVITVSGSQRAANLEPPSPLIELTNCEFKPAVLAVQAGESVRIHNEDAAAVRLTLYRHTEGTLDKGIEMDVIEQVGQESNWNHEMRQTGIYRIEGDAHPWLRAWVLVHEGIHKAVSGPDGRYTVERALPDGEYEVQAWHPRFKKRLSKTVQIVNGMAQVDFAFDYSHSFDAILALDS